MFWHLTFRELHREFAAARHRRTYDESRDIRTAWHTVRIWLVTKNKKYLPSLKSQLPKTGTPDRAQNGGQLKSALVILSEQYGIPLRTRKRRKVNRG